MNIFDTKQNRLKTAGDTLIEIFIIRFTVYRKIILEILIFYIEVQYIPLSLN